MGNVVQKMVILCSPTSEDYRHELVKGNTGLFFPPLGLLLVAQTLKNAGYDVKVFDGNCDSSYKTNLLNTVSADSGRIVYIGFYLAFLQIKECIEIIKMVRSMDMSIPIVTGGPFPSVFYEKIMESNLIDICCLGDGADVSVNIAHSLRKGAPMEGISNICYRHDGKMVVNQRDKRDNLTPENRILYENFIDIEKYVNKFNVYLTRSFNTGIKRAMPLLTGLGCSYKCAFCENALMGHKHLSRSAEDIIDYIRYYYKKFNIDSFSFFDEDFFIDKKRLYQFLALLEASNMKIHWGTQCRVNYFNGNYINHELLKWLEKTGCVRLSMGIESGSPKILKKINKGILPSQAISAAEVGRNSNIYFSYSFIVNLPEETRADFDMSFDLMEKLLSIKKNSFVSAIHQYFAYPGTPLSLEMERMKGRNVMESIMFENFASFSLESYNKLVNPQKADLYKECRVYYQTLLHDSDKNTISFRTLLRVVGHIRKLFGFYAFPVEIAAKKWIKSIGKESD